MKLHEFSLDALKAVSLINKIASAKSSFAIRAATKRSPFSRDQTHTQKLGSLPPRRLQARISGVAVLAGCIPRRSFRNCAVSNWVCGFGPTRADRPAMARTPVVRSLSCDATKSFVARTELAAIATADGIEWEERRTDGSGGCHDVTYGRRYRWSKYTWKGWVRVLFRDVID